jgi:hypothetical protein
VLWRGELQGFIVHEMVPSTGGFGCDPMAYPIPGPAASGCSQ